jgi:hypothetical protein
MPLQNFQTGSVISAAWLNGVDILATTVFQNATTVPQALTALGLTGVGGANYVIGPPTAGVALTVNGLAGSSAAQFLVTGVQVGAPTGGDKGVGTINLSGGLYVNGVQVAASNPSILVTSKPTNQSVASSITLAADANLVQALQVGIYALKMYVQIQQTAGGGGGFRFTLASSSGTMTGTYAYVGGIVGAFVDSVGQSGLAGVTTFAAISNAAPVDWLEISGQIQVTVAGTIQFQWAQNTSSAVSTEVLAGSWMQLTKVG